MEKITGKVERRPVAAGSKSERSAIVIDEGPGSQPVVLRRRGGNAFQDSALEELVGHDIEGEGARTSTTFILDHWRKVR